jgi:hypothetical protein
MMRSFLDCRDCLWLVQLACHYRYETSAEIRYSIEVAVPRRIPLDLPATRRNSLGVRHQELLGAQRGVS